MSPTVEPNASPGVAASAVTSPAAEREPSQATWAFKIFIDGGCPLCAKEARLMERLDRGRGRLVCEDLAAPGFDPAAYGRSYEQMMASIHGQLPDGRVISGLEVFRRAYAAVGMPWLLGWTRWPVIRPLAEAGYRFFARHRLTLTGRKGECDIGSCTIPPNER